jgi:hypothetical protein
MRTSLCVSCRTALAPGEACDTCGEKRVVSLTDPEGRARAFRASHVEEHVAGVRPPSTFRRLAFMAFVALVLMAALLGTVWAMLHYGAFGFIGGVVAGGIVVLFAVLSPMMGDSEKGSGEEEIFVRRVGTTYGPWPRQELARVTGQIRTRHPAAAVLVELSLSQGEVTLRDAVSHGFTVEIDGGRSVVVPASRIRIAGKFSLENLPRREVREHLALLDPAQGRSTETPFPFDRAQTLHLRDGDRITLAAAGFDESWDGDSGYRVGRGVTLRPRGLVWVLPA